LRRGQTLVNADTATDPLTAASYETAFAPIRLRSFVAVPLIKEGRWVALLAVHQDRPRRWRDEEVRLLEAVAERTWFVVENARLYQELREADRRKDEFLAMLGHELRNPLAPIRNALSLLKMPGADGADVREASRTIDRQVEHLVRLVDDLLDVSRIMHGRIELRKERIDLAEVVARAVETTQPFIDAHGHVLSVTLPPGPIAVEADPIRLSQVLGNLLHNAAKYTRRAGRIELAVERDGGEAVLRVRDPGVGMDPGLIPHVFDVFVQGERSLARSQGGLGLGLALVRRLVEMHGGHVAATSPGPGQGSEFRVRLPALAEALAADAGEARAASTPYTSRRILLVDDNVDAARSLAKLLRRWGHKVETTHDGPSALEAAHACRPEVVLLDIGLPAMDGYEVAKRLRAQPGFESIPLAAITGYGQDDDHRRSREAGFSRHFTKPVDPGDLQAYLGSLRSA
jgi:signal transduction histidine kinase/CheY-like chemotaxis protein